MKLSSARFTLARRVFIDHHRIIGLLPRFYMPMEFHLDLVMRMSAAYQIALLGAQDEQLPAVFFPSRAFARDLMRRRMDARELNRVPSEFVRRRIVWDDRFEEEIDAARDMVAGLMVEGWKPYATDGSKWWSVKNFDECRTRGEIVLTKHGQRHEPRDDISKIHSLSLPELLKRYNKLRRALDFWYRGVKELADLPLSA